MSRRAKICTIVIVLFVAVGVVFSFVRMKKEEAEPDYLQHVVAMEEGADPSLGITEFKNGDYTVDESFETHLPLVVIDLGTNEIPDAYTYDHDEQRFVLKDGMDPYVNADIKIIDSEDHDNKLGDEADLSSAIKIKYRGNSSIVYDKHQFRFSFLDEDGNKDEHNVLGMGKESDWILNISMIDESLVRNYMAYTICGEFMDYTPDVRYCEVILKKNGVYQYQGLYLMMETVAQGKDRVDISEFNPKNKYTSYLLRRDRYDEEDLMLDTYATRNELCYGYLALRYPTENKRNETAVAYVENDISEIEQVIFSEDEQEFLKYPQYIDEDSFIDYFLINEFLTNYDAGNNSTYYYRDAGDKLHIGPIWDYDNDLDNMGGYLLDPTLISFQGQPWYPQLTQSEEFDKKLIERYKELRKTYFSDEYFCDYVDDVVLFLGNAQKRDWSRWNEQYTEGRFDMIEDANGLTPDRNYTEYEDYVQRVKDVFVEHAPYILPALEELRANCRYKASYHINYGYGILFVLLLFVTIIMARRKLDH